MSYRGHVRNGLIVFDEPVSIPDGTEVEVKLVQAGPDEAQDDSVSRMLLKHAGVAKGLPPDLAENHDHYLHGVPKK